MDCNALAQHGRLQTPTYVPRSKSQTPWKRNASPRSSLETFIRPPRPSPGGRGGSGREEIAAFLKGCEMFLDHFRPDVVWTYGGDPGAMVMQQMAKRRGIPILFWLHNFAYTDRAAFALADHVIVPSEFSRRHYRDTLGLECHVLPNVVDPERVSVCSPGFSRNLGETPPKGGTTNYVAFVNPSPLKGVFLFARIAAELARRRPDIPLLIVEGASKAGSLPKLGIDLSRLKNVRIMPSTPDPRTFYAVTKLLLMPSLIESAGLVAMEAMTNGIPMLGSNRGGLPETIGDAGFLFDLPARYTPQTRTCRRPERSRRGSRRSSAFGTTRILRKMQPRRA